MGRNVDITFDVNTDVDTRRSYMLSLGGFIEEGETCGLLFFGEAGDDGTNFVPIPGPPGPPGEVGDSFELLLGDDVGTDDVSAWDDGAVVLLPTDTAGYALSELNKKLKEVADNGGGGGAEDGFHLPLGDIEANGDGSWQPGAVPLSDTTPVSEAVDRLNEVLGKLVPSAPNDFPNGTLAIANAAGTSPRLASGGVTDNSGGGSGYTPGGAVNRITAAGFSSNTFNDVGPGDNGTVTGSINGAVVGTRTLNGTTDNGNYSGLVISDQKDYPTAQPGFWKSIDVALSLMAAPVGINKAQAAHSGAGTTNEVFFVRDGLTATPAVSSGSVAQLAAGALAYSSSVPHYGTGATLTVGASLSNLAGETYYGGTDILTVSGQNSVINAQAFDYGALGVTTPIARQTTGATALSTVTVSVNGNTHGAGRVQAVGRNVNGASGATELASTTVLVKRGVAAASKVDELSVPVSGLGSSPNANNAVRVGTGAGDTPAGAATAWDATATLATHEAAVVAGVLGHNRTNYATGFLPAGPDLSTGRDGAQYVTFAFQRTARSAFKINVTGSYAGCWVKLPGVSDQGSISPNAPNGWWDGFKPYDGAGVPGETGDPQAGCAAGTVMTGGSGAFPITFGTQSSTNATDNVILVRFKLNVGQQITALNFSS